jgi:hypothetical protein
MQSDEAARQPSTQHDGFMRIRCTSVPTMLPCARIMEPYRYHIERRRIMGKYLLAWLLGVPAVVLVLIYLIF